MNDYSPTRPYSNPRDQWVSDQLNRHSSGSWKHTPIKPVEAHGTVSLWLIAVLLILGVMMCIATASAPDVSAYFEAMNMHPDCPSKSC